MKSNAKIVLVLIFFLVSRCHSENIEDNDTIASLNLTERKQIEVISESRFPLLKDEDFIGFTITPDSQKWIAIKDKFNVIKIMQIK